MEPAKEKRMQIYTDIDIGIKLIGYLECPKGWVGTVHAHNFWEIIIKTNDMNAFEFMVVPPNELHEFVKPGEDASTHLVYIGFDFKHDEGINREELKTSILDSLREKSNSSVYHYFYDTMMAPTRDRNDRRFLEAVTIFLIGLLGNHLFGKSETRKENEIVSEVKDLIDTNMDKMFTIEMIAGGLYISPRYLGEIFRKNTGEGILQYQKRQKMEKALILLKQGAPVKQVHRELGYDNVQYFSSSFKSYYGVSPIYYSDRNAGESRGRSGEKTTSL